MRSYSGDVRVCRGLLVIGSARRRLGVVGGSVETAREPWVGHW